jgi:hypothetical protein
MLAGILVAPASVAAQYVEPPPFSAYGLEGGNVVQANGDVEEGVTFFSSRSSPT